MEPGSYKNPTERFCELNPIFAKHKALTFTELYVKVLFLKILIKFGYFGY